MGPRSHVQEYSLHIVHKHKYEGKNISYLQYFRGEGEKNERDLYFLYALVVHVFMYNLGNFY